MSEGDRPPEPESNKRQRFRLIELLVIGAILLLVIGLFLPAVQKVRNGMHAKCMNNMRQIGLATTSAEGINRKLPPFFDSYAGKPTATIWYHLLPHLEQAGIYSREPPVIDLLQNKITVDPEDNAAVYKVGIYLCPSDRSGPPSGIRQVTMPNTTVLDKNGPVARSLDWGTGCYAANYLVFGLIPNARLDAIPDGVSNTVFFTEKAPVCNNTSTGQQGGNLWAAPPFFPKDSEYRYNYAGAIGYLPSEQNPTNPFLMTLFQVQPAAGQCDPNLAQTPHGSGIHVCMGDGSVRVVSGGISQETWSAMLRPVK